MNAETVPALAGQVELTVMQHASMAQVCLDLHDALGVRWGDNPYKRIDDLKRDSADLERERMRLAACGVVALANTPESAAKARDMHDDYRSASCADVARMVVGRPFEPPVRLHWLPEATTLGELEMPTGYTADIKDGIDFKTYAMNCARAFGACVMLRDEPGGGDRIPEAFEPSDYHLKAVEKARGELAALEAMTPTELERAAARSWDDAETSRLMRLEDKRKQREAYEAMLAKAAAWKAPTPDHEGLRKFMCEQIEQSIDFDCGGNYGETPTVRLTGEAWAAERRASLARDVQYHEKEHAGEVSRAATRTEWVRALRAAL